MAVSSDEELIGRVLNGRYAVGKRIARGGMASVFMATDTRLDRVVAVKVMHTGLGDDTDFTDRFVREARTAAQLNHPNVVSVFDQGTDGDIVYLVMEYVAGQTLRDVMRNEAPMPPARALGLLEQVLVGLSAAHAARMIHRDVKPENVLITPDGDVKVTDFGLARAVSAATTATGGTLIGTVSYLAPEIVLNEGADPRADVYACGAILYEMLTGFKPHSAESPIQVAYKHVHEDIGKPSAVIAGIPPYVDALVQRATARNRDQRSADALVLLQQVRQVRRAINAGITDDPELNRDLLPPFFEPAQLTDPGGNLDTEPTSVVDVADATTDIDEGTVVVTTAAAPAGTQVIDGHEDWYVDDIPAAVAAPVPGAAMPGSAENSEGDNDASRKKRGWFLAIAAALATILVATVGWYFGIGRYVDTPNVVGMTLAEAQEEAEAGGFNVKVEAEKFDNTEPPDTVLASSPGPGERILPGKTIAVTISKGKKVYELPDVRGKSVDEATSILREVTLEVTDEEERYHNKYKAGEVIGVVGIKPGAEVENGTEVTIAVSKGPEPLDVQSFVGRTEKEAVEGLKEAGFRVKVTHQYSDDVAEDRVISQDPDGGTAFRNDEISLVVSKGPEEIEVPNVRARRGNEAKKILTDAGFKVKFEGNKDNFVLNYSPNGKQKRGSTITLRMFP